MTIQSASDFQYFSPKNSSNIDIAVPIQLPSSINELVLYGQAVIDLRYKIVEVLPITAERIPSQPDPDKNIARGPMLYIRLIALYFWQ